MDEVTVAVLREIRDEIRSTRTELSTRIDQTNERLEQTNERLGVVEATLLDLAEQQRFVVRWLKAGGGRQRELDRRVDTLETRVDAIEERLPDRSR